MKHSIQAQSNSGFSLMELLVSMAILIPIMAGAVSLFSVGANQHGSEQSSVDVNQEIRAGIEMMAREIAQAGSHRGMKTALSSGVTGTASIAQTVSVDSTVGLNVGDWVDVGTSTDWESVLLTGVTASSITGVFKLSHAATAPVNLFAYPYAMGVIPPSGMAASSSANVTTLRIFGDITGDVNSTSTDANLYYIEYAYESGNRRITRSATPITQSTKQTAIPFINNVEAAQFTINTNALGIVTTVNLSITGQNTWSTASRFQQTKLSSRVLIPSAVAGTNLLYELRQSQNYNKLPPIPSQIITWAGLGGAL